MRYVFLYLGIIFSSSVVLSQENIDKKVFELAAENLSHEASICAAYYTYTSIVLKRDFTDTDTVSLANDMESHSGELTDVAIMFGMSGGRTQEDATTLHLTRVRRAVEEQNEFLDKYGYSELAATTGAKCKYILENPKEWLMGWIDKINSRFE